MFLLETAIKRFVLLAFSHVLAVTLGFALDIYTMPILAAPPAPTAAEVQSVARNAQYTGQFRKDLKGGDPLHWGEGLVSVSRRSIARPGNSIVNPATFFMDANATSIFKTDRTPAGPIRGDAHPATRPD